MKKRLAVSEKERLASQQKLATTEKHQESLRSTISSHEGTIATQTQLIADHTKTITSQKELIAELEVKVSTHYEIATSFMDIVMSDEGESEEGMSEERSLNNILKQMHDRVKNLENQVSSLKDEKSILEKDRDAAISARTELKGKMDLKSKEYNGLKTQLAIVEETTLSREKEIGDLRERLHDRTASTESISIENSKLRARLCEVERQNEELIEKNQISQPTVDPAIAEQLMVTLNEKDKEIADLKVTIDFSDNALKDASLQIKEESKNGKRLQELLNNEIVLKAEAQKENSDLKVKLSEAKKQLERSRALGKLSVPNKASTDVAEVETKKELKQYDENHDHHHERRG